MSGREEGPCCPVCNKRESLIMKVDKEETSEEVLRTSSIPPDFETLAWCSCGHIWMFRMEEDRQTHWEPIRD